MSSSHSHSQMLLSVIHIITSLVGVACQVGLLVVVMGAVRRHRPDAWKPLLVWAVGALTVSIVSPVVFSLSGLFASQFGGFDAYLMFQAALNGVFSLVHVVIVVLLARGLVTIAQPPKPLVVDTGVAYR